MNSARSGKVQSLGASVLIELGGATFWNPDCIHQHESSKPHTVGITMDASSRTYDWLLTPFPDPL